MEEETETTDCVDYTDVEIKLVSEKNLKDGC